MDENFRSALKQAQYMEFANEEWERYLKPEGDFKRFDFVKLDACMWKSYDKPKWIAECLEDRIWVVRSNFSGYIELYGISTITFRKQLFRLVDRPVLD